MRDFGRRLLDLLYPPKCAFCRRLVEDGHMLCPDCAEELPYVDPENLVQLTDGGLRCVSALWYDNTVRASHHRYKFRGAAAYCGVYGELMTAALEDSGLEGDIVTWVPLSRSRLRRRGYDQARLLAEEVAAGMDLPCEALLRKTVNNPAQSGRASTAERRQNVKGVYEVTENPEGLRIILVDDLVTTGATLSEAAGELLGAGAESVVGLTLARA
ncbi:MAG: ComF family protein [Oscillospiraceae bacterium]|nr:ComF family protein [Oscillospiraceae bacterium]